MPTGSKKTEPVPGNKLNWALEGNRLQYLDSRVIRKTTHHCVCDVRKIVTANPICNQHGFSLNHWLQSAVKFPHPGAVPSCYFRVMNKCSLLCAVPVSPSNVSWKPDPNSWVNLGFGFFAFYFWREVLGDMALHYLSCQFNTVALWVDQRC